MRPKLAIASLATHILLILATALQARVTVARDLPPVLTLSEAIRYAQQHSGLVQAARAGTEALEARLRQAEWAAWPHASIRALLAPMARQWGTPMEGGTDLKEWGIFAYTEVVGTWPIYTFGKISNLKRAARLGVDVGRAREDVARSEVAFRVKKAFHALVLAREMAEVIREGRDYLDKARRHLDNLEAADDPSFDPVDRMKMRVTDASVLGRELQAIRGAEAARALLRATLGLDPADPVEFEVGRPRPVLVSQDLSLEDLVRRALDSRSDLVALRRGLKVREAEVAARRSAFFPNLFLAGQFRYGYSNVADPQASPFANDPFNTYSAGGAIGLEMDLEIGKKLGELREAEAEAERLRAEVREAERGVRLEVEKTFREMQDARRMVAALEDAVAAARGWVIAKTDLYDNDLGDLDDVLAGLVQFFQARMESLQAIYDFNVAVASLERAAGADLTCGEGGAADMESRGPVPGGDE